jgi:hypothetical protein
MTELKCLKRTDYKKARKQLSNSLNSLTIMNIEDPDIISDMLIKLTQEALSDNTSTIKMRVKANKIQCPWFNWKVLNALKKKQRLMRKIKRAKGVKNRLRHLLKDESVNVKRMIEREKRNFYNVHLNNSNPRAIWKNLNGILGRNNKSQIQFLNINGSIMTDELLIAQKVNEFFIKSVTETVNDQKVNASCMNFNSVPHSLVMEEADEKEIAAIIRNLKNSSPGYDNISSFDVKNLNEELCPVMCHLINAILRSGKYPRAFKFATVIPISKTGSFNDLNDLRPISILSTFNKIVEKFLYDRILKYVLRFDLLSKYQFGFRPKSSTEAAATELVSAIRKTIDNKKFASVVFMDIKKAFDLVDRKILMRMLNLIGIRGKAEEIIHSYLSERFQAVKIGSKISSPLEVLFGVVQGSILGSLLFNIFFNEITKIDGVKGKIILYADDLALINEHNPKEDVSKVIKHDMELIIKFLSHQRMIINIKKTNFMVFHSPFSKCIQPEAIKINEHYTILRIMTMKYLGLHLDPHLKWDVHGSHVAKKLTSGAGIMWKLKNVLPMSAKKKIYHSLFATHISYMVMLWGNACDTVIKPIQIIQNRMIRNMYGLDRMHNRVTMYKDLAQDNILPIRAMNFLNTASFVFSCRNRSIHTNLIFESNKGSRTRMNLRVIAAKSKFGKKDIHNFGVNVFNYLPLQIRKAVHIHSFKFHVKQFLSDEKFLSQCFDNGYLKLFG